jgi:hypothetical protein
MEENLTLQEATDFFAEFYLGAHHIPGKIKEFGYGFVVLHDRGDLATFDYNQLTRLVLLAHSKCYRASVFPCTPRILKIGIWKRKREGGMSSRHPTIEQAIEDFNKPRQI